MFGHDVSNRSCAGEPRRVRGVSLLVLAGTAMALSSCNKLCPQGGKIGKLAPAWVHKGTQVIRHLVPELPTTGATVTATLLKCPLVPGSGAANAVAQAQVVLDSQLSASDPILTSCSPTPSNVTSFWQINDTTSGASGTAYLFHTTGGRDVFAMDSGTSVGWDVDFWPD